MSGEPTRIVSPEGQRSKKNGSGSPIVKNTVVRLDPAVEDEIDLPSASTDPIYGVLQNADLPDGDFGTIQIRDKALCRAAGALATPGIRLMADTAGRVLAHTGTNAVLGVLLTTAAAIDNIVEVDLLGPGATGT